MKKNLDIEASLFVCFFTNTIGRSNTNYKDISEYSDKEIKDLQKNIEVTLKDILGNPSENMDIQEMLNKLGEYLKSEKVDILKRSFLAGEDISLTEDEQKKLEMERLAIIAENGENHGIEAAMLSLDDQFILNLYKKRKNLEYFTTGKASKKDKQDYKKLLEVAASGKDEIQIETENKIKEFLSVIHSVSKETERPIETIITDFKQMSIVLISEDLLNCLQEVLDRSNEVLEQRRLEKLAKEEAEKALREQEEQQRKLEELKAKAKNDAEARLLEKQAMEKRQAEERKKQFEKPIEQDEGRNPEFYYNLRKKDNQITVKEYIFPVFIRLYTKKNEKLFDSISKEKMRVFVSKLKEYEKISNKKSKFIIMTNQRIENLHDWMLELDKFLVEEGMPARVDSGVEKYGTNICEMNGNIIPVSKMSPEIRKKVEDIVKGGRFSTGLEEYINETELDYLRLDFPKKTKELEVIQIFSFLNKIVKTRKDALTFSTFHKGNGKKGIDIILKSQAEIGERLFEYLSRKYYLEPKKGVSFTAEQIDETIQKLNVFVEKKKSEEEFREK